MKAAGYLVTTAAHHMLLVDRERACEKAAAMHGHMTPLVAVSAVLAEIERLRSSPEYTDAQEALGLLMGTLERLR